MVSNEKEIGYELCKDCESGIHLKEAGFEVKTSYCEQCHKHVASKEEFFNVHIEILSK